MRCNRFEDRLNELLDQRANPLCDQRLAHHAEHCPDCRALLETQQIVLSIYHQKRLEPQDAAPIAITAPPRHRSRQATEPPRRKTTWLALLTTACVVALLVGRWIAQPGRRPDGKSRNLVASPLPPQDSRPASATDPASQPTLPHPSFPPSASTLSENYSQWVKWREVDLGWLLPETEEVPRLSKAQLLDRVKQVGGSIRPLTSSVSSTLNILKRTWPGTQTPAKSSADQAVIPAESDLLV